MNFKHALMKTTFSRAGAAIVAAVFFLSSCSKRDGLEGYIPDNAVLFSANINAAPQTKAANGAWSENDEIGIFMLETGTTDVADNTTNRKYTTVSGDGSFSASSDDLIYYPEDGSKVDFIAYYPHQPSITTLGDYVVNVADQSDQETIDLLYAHATNSGDGYDRSHSSAVGLQFRHQLSRVRLVVATPAPELHVSTEELADMTAGVSGLNTTATFNLADGGLGGAGDVATISLHRPNESLLYDAIIVPGEIANGNVAVTFAAGSQSFVWAIPEITYESGKSYTYNVTLEGQGLASGVVASIVDWEVSEDSDEFFIPPAELGTVVNTAAELRDAILSAQPGDIISLASGFKHDWGAPIDANNKDWSSNPITIQSANNANRAELGGRPFSFVGSSGVIFKNLDFVGGSLSSHPRGIRISGGSKYAIIGCKFTNVRESVATSSVSHLTIEYNDFLTTPEVGSEQNYADFVRAFQQVDYLKIRKNRMIKRNTKFGDLSNWHPDFIQFGVSDEDTQGNYRNNRGGECVLIEDNILYRPDFFRFSPNPIWSEGALGVNILHNANNNTQGIIAVNEYTYRGNRNGYVRPFEKSAFRKFVIRNNDFINSMANTIAIMCTDGLIIEGNRIRTTPGTPGLPGYDHWFSLDDGGNRTDADARATILLYQVDSYRFDPRIYNHNVLVRNNSASRAIIGGGRSGFYEVEDFKTGENESPNGWQNITGIGIAYLPDDLNPWAWPENTLPAGWLNETPKDGNNQWTVPHPAP